MSITTKEQASQAETRLAKLKTELKDTYSRMTELKGKALDQESPADDSGESFIRDPDKFAEFNWRGAVKRELKSDIVALEKQIDAWNKNRPKTQSELQNPEITSALEFWARSGEHRECDMDEQAELLKASGLPEEYELAGKSSRGLPFITQISKSPWHNINALDLETNTNINDPRRDKDLVWHLQAYGGAEMLCRHRTTPDGNVIKVPYNDNRRSGYRLTNNDTAITYSPANNTSDIVVNADTVDNIFKAGASAAHGQTSIGAQDYMSGPVDEKISAKNDVKDVYSESDTEAVLAERIYRVCAADLLYGPGTAQAGAGTADHHPQGIDTVAWTGATAGSQTVIRPEDCIVARAAMEPAYLGFGKSPVAQLRDRKGTVGIIVNWDTYNNWARMTVGDNAGQTASTDRRPLLIVSSQPGMPDTLYGMPVVIDFTMNATATNVAGVYLGNFGDMLIRTVDFIVTRRFFGTPEAKSHSYRYLSHARKENYYVGAKFPTGDANAGKAKSIVKIVGST